MAKNKHTYIIAEAGVNHNGHVKTAKELIDAAVEAKADAVKFQTFSAESLVSQTAPKAAYQTEHDAATTQLEMLKALELSLKDFETLYEHAKKRNITFLSTAFDINSLSFLIKTCNIPQIKVPSGEITHAKLLYEVGKQQKPILLSTGISTLKDIENALAILAYSWHHQAPPHSLETCLQFMNTKEAKACVKENITILHCTSEYPAPYSDINLNALTTLKDTFGTAVGLSDHSLGIHAPIAAVALGASVIEKHFTLSKDLDGPDHSSSLEPNEFNNMVSCIRDIELAMGDGEKAPSPSELKNKEVVRRYVVAASPIKKGDIFTSENVVCKRTGGGLDALFYWDLLGKESEQDYNENEIIKEN